MLNFEGFHQNSYVTRDLDKAIVMLGERYNLHDFIHFEPEMTVDTSYGGRGFCHVKVAMAWADGLMFELVQPIAGLVQHYVDFLPDDDSLRFHHAGMRVPDWDACRSGLVSKGEIIAYEGEVPGVNWLYVDARATLGHYLEYTWVSPEMWKAMGGPD